MSDAKFTKGPWLIEYDNGDSSAEGQWYVVGPARIRFPYGASEADRQRALFDASLIAAAPELYEALTFFVTHPGVWQLCSPDSRAMQTALAARSKALGDSK